MPYGFFRFAPADGDAAFVSSLDPLAPGNFLIRGAFRPQDEFPVLIK